MTHGRVTAQHTKGLLMWVMTHGIKGQGQTAGAVNSFYYHTLGNLQLTMS